MWCSGCGVLCPIKGAPVEVKSLWVESAFFLFSLKTKCIPYCYIYFAAYETDEVSPLFQLYWISSELVGEFSNVVTWFTAFAFISLYQIAFKIFVALITFQGSDLSPLGDCGLYPLPGFQINCSFAEAEPTLSFHSWVVENLGHLGNAGRSPTFALGWLRRSLAGCLPPLLTGRGLAFEGPEGIYLLMCFCVMKNVFQTAPWNWALRIRPICGGRSATPDFWLNRQFTG